MFGLIKELVDRFIEFVLMFAKGDTPEEKLTAVLKSAVLLIVILAWSSISLALSNLNQRVEIKDMQAGIARMNQLFDPKVGSPISSFIRINDTLTKTLNMAKEENFRLASGTIRLSDENNFLRPLLYRALETAERVNMNNDLLVKLCVPEAVGSRVVKPK